MNAIIRTNAGTALRILLRNEIEILLPMKDKLIIAGKVPKPNIAIKSAPFKLLPVAMAPAIPMYTSPQGSIPFSVPIKNNEELEFLVNSNASFPFSFAIPE